MSAYYNEIDSHAAAWLRNLISAGHIAPGDVDERSIEDVRPSDLKGYRQCHFFAGIGAWSLALRMAGWPDDMRVWTGSCPCQPFSPAGKGLGANDARHLYPAWSWLIRQCRPATVFGEQVANGLGAAWLDAVLADLEGLGFAVGAAHLPACGVGAPHLRMRAYFVADSVPAGWAERGAFPGGGQTAGSGWAGAMADSGGRQCDGIAGGEGRLIHGPASRREQGDRVAPGGREVGGVGNPKGVRCKGRIAVPHEGERYEPARTGPAPGPVNGFWGDAEWLYCRDGKYRAAKPGIFPLAHGAAARVVRLRAYGNAIVPQVAAEFVKAFMRCKP